MMQNVIFFIMISACFEGGHAVGLCNVPSKGEYCFASPLSAQSWENRDRRREPKAGTMPYSHFE